MSNKNQIGIEAGRVSVYWTNLGYYAGQTFATIEEAVAHAKKVYFEATFVKDGEAAE